jgi:hypothetical protein
MNNTNAAALREALLQLCYQKPWTNPQAVTLTLKLARAVDQILVPLTVLDAQQNLRHFLNVMHKKLRPYGITKRTRLQCVPIFEGHSTVRKHIHLMIDRPHTIGDEDYATLIECEWRRTVWGHQKVTVEPCYDCCGWLRYISKVRSKQQYADAIDWTNFS